MKKIILFIFLIWSCNSLFAQYELSQSPQNSIYMRIYKLSAAEADKLTQKPKEMLNPKYWHTFVDSIPIDKMPSLPVGNYLLVKIIGNEARAELLHNTDFFCQSLTYDKDLILAIYDKQGHIISDAQVFSNRKAVPFDKKIQAYRVSNYQKNAPIRIFHNNLFLKGGTTKSYYRNRPFLNKIRYKLLRPFRYKDHSENVHFLLNKPIYRPNDTVKVKIYVFNSHNKPVNKTLHLRLHHFDYRYPSEKMDSLLQVLKPYRKGTYEYSFVLNEGLKMKLDKYYDLTLDKYETSKSFKYEDYELKAVTFSARSDEKKHYRGEPLSVYLKAVDENELAVLDGKAQITLLKYPSYRGISGVKGSYVFIPDTLWVHDFALEPLGETQIILPDSIFPQASFNYRILCEFWDATHEKHFQELHNQSFKNEEYQIKFTRQNDSLWIEQYKGTALQVACPAILTWDNNDSVQITLPTKISLNPYQKNITVKTVNAIDSIKISDLETFIQSYVYKKNDNIVVEVKNPTQQYFWYTIFKGKKIQQEGYANQLYYTQKTEQYKQYKVLVRYIQGSDVRQSTAAFADIQFKLNLNIQQPVQIYPGQTADININVTDGKGKAVENVDLTAFAYTKKFPEPNYYYSYFPTPLNKKKRIKSIYPLLGINFYPYDNAEYNIALGNNSLTASDYIKSIFALDSIEYYRFLYPNPMYIKTEPTKDSITQIAPFVTKNGVVQKPYAIYIDEVPVFYAYANHLQPYSFPVNVGIHTIRIRLYDKEVTIYNVETTRKKKTFVSIDIEKFWRSAVKDVGPTLLPFQKDFLNRYTIRVDNNFNGFSYIKQQESFFPLPTNSWSKNILVSPLNPFRYAQLFTDGNLVQEFMPEGNFDFWISRGLIKQRQPKDSLVSGKISPYNLKHFNEYTPLTDYVFTQKDMDNFKLEYNYQRMYKNLFDDSWKYSYNSSYEKRGILYFTGENDRYGKILLFIRQDPYQRFIFPNYRGTSLFIPTGNYKLYLLLSDSTFVMMDSISIKPNGTNYLQILPEKLVRINQFNHDIRISSDGKYTGDFEFLLWKKDYNSLTEEELQKISVRDGSKSNVTMAGDVISGEEIQRLSGRDASAIVATMASVGVADGSQGAIRGMRSDGQVTIVDGVKMYGTQGIPKGAMQEVVSFRNETLSETLRPFLGSFDWNMYSKSLIILDHLPYSGKLEDIDKSTIAHIKILSPEEAKQIFGKQGENGVLIITRITSGEAFEMANSMRKNFRDDAFWQPRLTTDRDGKASFKVTYPDDITAWRTKFYAIKGKNQMAFTEQIVRSYKLVGVNLALPRFAVAGDSLFAIGKIQNYNIDSLSLTRTIAIENKPEIKEELRVTTSKIDNFLVVAPQNKDSITIKYSLQLPDGYFDGEERGIPIHPQGTLETHGFFTTFKKDTAFTLTPLPTTNQFTITADASALPVLLDEIEKVSQYRYYCNEQTASKLKALLMQKKIYAQLKQKWDGERNINALIKRLNESKSENDLWGWWQSSPSTGWISRHVIEALLMAEGAGYKINLDKAQLTDYFVLEMENPKTQDIASLRILKQLNAQIDYIKYIDLLENNLMATSFYNKLQIWELKQQLGMPIALDSLVKLQRKTMFGNIYWTHQEVDRKYYCHLFKNDMQYTLSMYRLLRKEGNHDELLEKIRNYFFEQRKNGSWMNTYESSLVLETLLPDMLTQAGNKLQKPVLYVNQTLIDTFPYKINFNNNFPVHIKKEGSLPVYFSAFEKTWNSNPKAADSGFAVKSFFEKNKDILTHLKAGEAATIKVNVHVENYAEYVLIEIPIPAGCSYQSKNQTWSNYEIHREYFADKVSIFCSKLNRGNYTFSVELMPRFSGSYHLNPAKAELMYFPVFYGQTEMKKVRIE